MCFEGAVTVAISGWLRCRKFPPYTIGLLHLPPHELDCDRTSSPDGSDSSGKKSKSRPPVQAACDKRPISPIIGSVIDVCVVTLLPVVPVAIMDVAVACGTSGYGCTNGSPIPLWG